MNEDPILFRHLVDIPHENAAGLIEHRTFSSAMDQTDDGIQQVLAIAGKGLGPDHQIHAQPLVAPVGIGPDHLAGQAQVGEIVHAQEDDGQVARDTMAPKARGSFTIAGDQAGAGSAPDIRVENRAGCAAEKLRLRLTDPQLMQQNLIMGPGQVEEPLGQAVVMIFIHQGHGASPVFINAHQGIHGDALSGRQPNPAAHSDNGVQHIAAAVG